MSHYTKVKTKLVSRKHLVEALKSMGFPEVECHEAAQALIGVDGYESGSIAEIIVRRAHVGEASNDIGFVMGRDGTFTAIISEWDQQHYNAKWLEKLTQRYSYFATKEALAEQDFDLVSEDVDEDESIRLVLRRMA